MTETEDGRRAIASWVGTLASGGLITNAHQEAGLSVAAYVVGESRLGDLRDWIIALDDEAVETAQRATIATLIWMAHADRKIDPKEAELLEEIVLQSRMSAEVQKELLAALKDPPSLDQLAVRVGHPVLAELLIALSWELADADGDISRSEETFMDELTKKLGVDPERVAEIRDAVVARVAG